MLTNHLGAKKQRNANLSLSDSDRLTSSFPVFLREKNRAFDFLLPLNGSANSGGSRRDYYVRLRNDDGEDSRR